MVAGEAPISGDSVVSEGCCTHPEHFLCYPAHFPLLDVCTVRLAAYVGEADWNTRSERCISVVRRVEHFCVGFEPGSLPGEGAGVHEGIHLECLVVAADDYVYSGFYIRTAKRAIVGVCCYADGGALILIRLLFHLREVRSLAVSLSCFPYLRDPA